MIFIGLFIGTFVGFFLCAALTLAQRADDAMELHMQSKPVDLSAAHNQFVVDDD